MEWVLNPKIKHQRFFEELTRIPHGSYKESLYGDYLERFAREHGFSYRRDEIGNVVMYKPASEGYEDHPYVAIQAHMDMVCVKDEGVIHDFEKDPLEIYIENGFVRARGTTLGADDGTGVAYILAILDEKEAKHPPLEAIFTVQEEVGLHGALALKAEDIKSRQLISLDCGGGDSIYISSLGGHKGQLIRKVAWEDVETETGTGMEPGTETESESEMNPRIFGYELNVGGLKGGYSHGYLEEQGNANHLAARLLKRMDSRLGIRLALAEGGEEEGKIARTCSAVFTSKAPFAKVQACLEEELSYIKKELGPADPDVAGELNPCRVSCHLREEDSRDLLNLMFLLPCGFRHRHTTFPEIMSAAVNWSLISTREEESAVVLTYALRGSADSMLEQMHEEIVTLAGLLGAEDRTLSSFPAWEFHDSHLLHTLQKVFREHYGKEVGLIPVQGGLECGVFAGMHPDMDIIAMGPFGYDVHTTAERMDLENFNSLFVVFRKLLESL